MATDVSATYSGRQYPLAIVIDFSYATFTKDTAYKVAKLPAGAVITDVILQVRTAWDNTTPVFNVGLNSVTPNDPDDFLDAVSLAAGDETHQVSIGDAGTEAALDASDLNHITNADYISVLHTAASGTPTTGAATLIVQYVVRGRDQENAG